MFIITVMLSGKEFKLKYPYKYFLIAETRVSLPSWTLSTQPVFHISGYSLDKNILKHTPGNNRTELSCFYYGDICYVVPYPYIDNFPDGIINLWKKYVTVYHCPFIPLYWNVYIPDYANVNDTNPEYFNVDEIIIENPQNLSTSLHFCELAVNKNVGAFYFTEVYSQNMCNFAFQQSNSNISVFRKIPDKFKNKEMCKMAVEKNGNSLEFVPNYWKTEELCTIAVGQNMAEYVFKHVPDELKSEELCKLAISKNADAIAYASNQTEELCTLAINKNACVIQYIKNQTEELCKLAVKNRGYSLCGITNKTEEICLLAVKQDGLALEFVDTQKQTKEICIQAVKQNKHALRFVDKNILVDILLNS